MSCIADFTVNRGTQHIEEAGITYAIGRLHRASFVGEQAYPEPSNTKQEL
jgi:hypothetical protein